MHLTLEHAARLVCGLRLHMVMAATTWPYNNGGEEWIRFEKEVTMVVDKELIALLFLWEQNPRIFNQSILEVFKTTIELKHPQNKIISLGMFPLLVNYQCLLHVLVFFYHGCNTQ